MVIFTPCWMVVVLPVGVGFAGSPRFTTGPSTGGSGRPGAAGFSGAAFAPAGGASGFASTPSFGWTISIELGAWSPMIGVSGGNPDGVGEAKGAVGSAGAGWSGGTGGVN